MRRALGGPSAGALPPPAPTRRPRDPNAPTVLVINDSRDQINYGAEALVEGLLHILRVALPNHTLRLIPSHWLDEAGIPSAFHSGDSLEYPGESALWPAVADQFECVADEWLAGRGGRGAAAYLEKLEGVDIVVLNGEGSIYRTNISAVRELFLAWFAKTQTGDSNSLSQRHGSTYFDHASLTCHGEKDLQERWMRSQCAVRIH